MTVLVATQSATVPLLIVAETEQYTQQIDIIYVGNN